MYYSFIQFCTNFTERHITLNGRAVDTFFSQIKHTTSGQLSSTSVNNASARGTVITRGSVHGKLRWQCGDYRNAPLFIRRHALKCKPPVYINVQAKKVSLKNHHWILHKINFLKKYNYYNFVITSIVVEIEGCIINHVVVATYTKCVQCNFPS